MVEAVLFTDHSGMTVQSWSRGLGTYRIQTELRRAGYTCDVIDFISVLSLDQIITIINTRCDENTLIVGWSATFLSDVSMDDTGKLVKDNAKTTRFTREEQKQIYYAIKARSPKAKVLVGALDVYGRDQYFADMFVMGHADRAIVGIAAAIRDGGYDDIGPENPKIIRPDVMWPVTDLSRLSVDWGPEHHIMSHEWIPIEVSRGCIFNCKFCSHVLRGKKKLDYLRDPDDIYQEIMGLYERFGVTRFILIDDTLNDTIQKLEMLKSVTDRLPFRPKFNSFVRVDLIARFPRMLELMDDIGLITMHLGIESRHPEALKAIGKSMPWEKIEETILHIRQNYPHMRLFGSFIVGLPYEDLRSVAETNALIGQGHLLHDWVWYGLAMHSKNQNKHHVSEFNQSPEQYGYTTSETHASWWENEFMNSKIASRVANKMNAEHLENRYLAGFALPMVQSLHPDPDYFVQHSMAVLLTPEFYADRYRLAESMKINYFAAVVPEITYVGGYNR